MKRHGGTAAVVSNAQDLGELFDVVDPSGAPLGRTKPRGLVHRDGDWHRSVHIWVWGILCGAPWVVLQRRSVAKDTWPRALDVAVTGHLRAGETIEDALREADEEIGLPVRAPELVRLGLRRRQDHRQGVLDNEVQGIFATAAPVELEALRPNPSELEALLAVPLRDATAVLHHGAKAQGVRLGPQTGAGHLPADVVWGREAVPATDGYYAKALASLHAMVSGQLPVPWELG